MHAVESTGVVVTVVVAGAGVATVVIDWAGTDVAGTDVVVTTADVVVFVADELVPALVGDGSGVGAAGPEVVVATAVVVVWELVDSASVDEGLGEDGPAADVGVEGGAIVSVVARAEELLGEVSGSGAVSSLRPVPVLRARIEAEVWRCEVAGISDEPARVGVDTSVRRVPATPGSEGSVMS